MGDPRPAQQADWVAIMDAPRVTVASDMNAHSRMWNGRAAYQHNDTFWGDLVETHGLTIHNSEEVTRSGANAECHSIIDLTLTKRNVYLRWSIACEDQSTGSNHEILVWEVVEKDQGGPSCKVTTGWNLPEFKRTDGTPEEQEKRKEARGEAKRQWEDAAERRGLAAATKEGVEEEARWIRDTAASILDEFAKPRWVCLRSKSWWADEISELSKQLGRARRAHREIRTEATKAARRNLRRAIRRAKKAYWNSLLENATGGNVCTPVRYINLRPDDSARPLINGGSTAIAREDDPWNRLPRPPADNGVAAPRDGTAYRAIDQALVGHTLAGCSNQSAPREDRMGAEIVKASLGMGPGADHQPHQAMHQSRHPPRRLEDSQGNRHTKIRKTGLPASARHRVIVPLDSLGKLVEKTAAHLIADQLERGRELHEGQYGCCRRRSYVGCGSGTHHQAWNRKYIMGALPMDVKSPSKMSAAATWSAAWCS